MKYQTMLRILFLLLARDRVTAKYIAERFEISLRTVYRYIDELSFANVPIYNVRGRNGGYAIADNYKITNNYLTEEEQEKIISTLTEINKELGSQVLDSAILKISAISKKGEAVSINLGNLVIDGSGWGSGDVYGTTLKLLQEAIENRAVLNVHYVNRTGDATEREFEPHTLVLKQGLWYCYAYCRLRNEFRLFKVGRIRKCKLTGENFERRETEDMESVLSKWYSEVAEDIDIELTPQIKADVEEWLGLDKVTTLSSGKITATFKHPVNEYLTAKILSFGKNVKVLAPLKLKKAIIKTAQDVENIYKN